MPEAGVKYAWESQVRNKQLRAVADDYRTLAFLEPGATFP
jgi:hypothetical protein